METGEFIESSLASRDGKTLFATVGTTRFDALVSHLLSESSLKSLSSQGITRIVLQHGSSPIPGGCVPECSAHGISLKAFRFADGGISTYLRDSHVVVSHAGAGTLMEALEEGCRIVAVINRSLMDDHQSELARALHVRKALVSADVQGVTDAVAEVLCTKPTPLDSRNTTAIAAVVAEELGEC